MSPSEEPQSKRQKVALQDPSPSDVVGALSGSEPKEVDEAPNSVPVAAKEKQEALLAPVISELQTTESNDLSSKENKEGSISSLTMAGSEQPESGESHGNGPASEFPENGDKSSNGDKNKEDLSASQTSADNSNGNSQQHESSDSLALPTNVISQNPSHTLALALALSQTDPSANGENLGSLSSNGGSAGPRLTAPVVTINPNSYVLFDPNPPSETNAPGTEPKPKKTRLMLTSGNLNLFRILFSDWNTNAIVTWKPVEDASSVKDQEFDCVHICVTMSGHSDKPFKDMEAFLVSGLSLLEKCKTVALHIHFHLVVNWNEAPDSLKKAHLHFMDTVQQHCGPKVSHLSIIDKHHVELFDEKGLLPLPKDIQGDISRWENLKTLDFTNNFIEKFPRIKFPDTLEDLNISGGFALTSITGIKMPSGLKQLQASLNALSNMDHVVFPPTLEKLDLLDNKIYFLHDVDFPQTLQDLDVSANRIDTLRGVNFPRNLKFLNLLLNPIECIKGVRFPELIEYLDLSCNANESMTGIKFPDNTKELNLQSSMTNTRGLKLPPHVVELNMAGNGVNSINPLKLPNSIKSLLLSDNNIKTLNKVVFPQNLKELWLGNNLITTLKNVHFPQTLEVLDFQMDPYNEESDRHITSLKDVFFPPNLRVLRLGYHQIKNIEGVEFPYALEELNLQYNDMRVFRNVKFGPNLRVLDLSGNQNLSGLDSVYFPESLRELKVASQLVDHLPATIVERANRHELKLSQSVPYEED